MSKEKHHHGDLREALISAGIDLMEAGGPAALSLRKCAAKAGVSHAAPAHHFNGIISLKAAIVARSYEIFAETMQAHRCDISEPRARLAAICEGYLAFARSHAALFQFMFQPFPPDFAQINPPILAELEQHSTLAYHELEQACAPFALIGGQEGGIEVMVWSLVHGYAMLFACTPEGRTPAGAPPDFAQILPDFPLRK
jgi:AcrR family transcriptional regulator